MSTMTDSGWLRLFAEWPAEMPRRGIAVTTFGEQIPFSGFRTSETFLFLERQTPDSLGARTIIVPYVNLAAVKLTDVVKASSIQNLGFSGPAK